MFNRIFAAAAFSISINAAVFAQQPLVNNFSKIYIKQGAQVYVKTNSLSNNDLLDNAGELTIEEDFINNQTANGGGTAGIYNVQRDWINNGVFSADQSKVNLYGPDQLITGSSITAFYDLELTGTGIKKQTINSETSHLLTLNDRELATDGNEMLISNADPAAISRTSGFVSSLSTGRLSRVTNSTSSYLFPTGSSLGTLRFRPVEIAADDATANTYGARLANTDATAENFDRQKKDTSICEINQLYYHRIYHSTGSSSADVEINYDPGADGEWDDVAHWQTVPLWEKTNAVASSAMPFSSYSLNNWNDFSYSSFALARSAPFVTAGNDTTILRGESVQLNSSVTGPFTTVTWSPITGLDDPNASNPVATPEESTTYLVSVENGSSACKHSDEVRITVEDAQTIAIPDAFSPDGNSTNSTFRILNSELLKTAHIRIYNRWGEKVFEESDPNFKWEGTYKDEPQPLATFVWVLEAETIFNSKIVKSGTVTLVR